MSGLSSASAGLTGDLAATGTSGNLLVNSSGDVGAATGTTWNNTNQQLRIEAASGVATTPTLYLKKSGGASSVLDLENDYSGKVLRVLGPPDVSAKDPVTYIGNGGEISTRAWLVVSGSTSGTGDSYAHTEALNSGTYPQMVSIWSDVKHALMIRPFNAADGLPLTSLDRNGKFRFGWREYGEMGWGPSTATDETGWDVGLIRGAVHSLYVTDGQSTANTTGYLYALGLGTGNAGASLKIEYGYVSIRGDGELRWSSVSDYSGSTKDVGMHRSAAGVLGIHDGITTTTYRDLKLRNVDATGTVAVASATATPAGGSTSVRIVFGTTAGFGVYVGSGAPSVSAAQGSLYLRSDGSSTSTRAYINSDGSTTWVAITTAS